MLGVGWIGQSNMAGVANWAQNPSPPSAPSLARVKFFNVDFYDSLDDAGIFRPMAFSPSGLYPVLSSYDYDPNRGDPAIIVANGAFGPAIYGSMALADHLGTDVLAVKAATGGLYLTQRPVTLSRFNTAWFWPCSHNSWDTTVAHSTAPYTATVRESGTASSIVTLGIPPFALVTDGSKSWAPGSKKDFWCVVGGSFGRILDNTATTLTIEYFFPNIFGALPAAGPYTIEQRDAVPASWAKTFADGNLVGAKAADPTFDLQVVGIALGESDSMERSLAEASKESMQRLIWYVRNRAVAHGVTSLDAHQIGISMSLIPVIDGFPYAEIVNAGFREIAASDPHVRLVQTQDLPRGGFLIPGLQDDFHYTAIGQIEHGKRHGAAMVDLLSVPSTAARASQHYPGRHKVVSPLWGSPPDRPWRWEPDAQRLAAYGSKVDLPHAYADKGGEPGASSVRVLSAGYGLSSSRQGTPWGYALPRRGDAMLDVSNLQFSSPHRGAPSAGSASLARARGFVWPAGSMAGQGFAERSTAHGSHLIYRAANCGNKVTRWSTGGVEWMRRGYNGAFGIGCQLMIEENVGDGSTPWMTHRIGEGDASRSQTQGTGWSKVPPTDVDRCIAMEYGADELAPYPFDGSTELPSLTADQIRLIHNHGGDSSLSEAVLWPGVSISSEVTPDWLGIVGCFRVVHTIASEGFHHPYDRVSIQQRVFVDYGLFDVTNSYDPESTTLLPWNRVGNLTRTFRAGDHDDLTPGYSLSATGSGPFTGAGAALLEQSGGIVVGLYQSMVSTQDIGGAYSLTVSGSVAASAAPGYASYDQLDHGYLLQVCTQAAGEILPVERRAMFLLVGDIATVKAAADQLFAMGVDAKWTD